MNEKELEKIILSTEIEPISIESFICLKEDYVENGYGRWGWSKNLDTVKLNFLYGFVIVNVLNYNEKKVINKICNDFIISIICEESFENMSLVEKEFLNKWNNILKINKYSELKKAANKFCKFLSSLGYIMEYTLFKNPKQALPKALELEHFISDDEMSFGKFLLLNLLEEGEVKI